jgi:uncharacterized protein (UPF0261 family)
LTHHGAALLVATMDSRGLEAIYLSDCLKSVGIPVIIMDAGIRGTSEAPVDITRQTVAQAGGSPLKEVQNISHEGEILVPMNGFSAFDHPDGPLHDPTAPQRFVVTLEKNLIKKTICRPCPVTSMTLNFPMPSLRR